MMDVVHFSPRLFEQYQEAGDRMFLDRLREADALYTTLGVNAISNRWHLQSAWKRAIGVFVYGDLFGDGTPRRRVHEIGGGLSAITMGLAQRQDYSLVELATHESEADYRKVEKHLGQSFFTPGDWLDVAVPQPVDVVIANDLFPNVDQRLEWFLERYLSTTKETRLTLTYYENTAWQVKRISSGETLTVKPWGLRDVTGLLDHLAERFGPFDRSQLVYEDYEGRLFTNRRNILWVRLVREADG